jgi:hypothetical protein
LAEGLCDVKGIILAEGLHDLGSRSMYLLHLCSGVSLQLGKSMENLSHGSRLVLDTSRCVDLVEILGAVSTGLLSIGPPRLSVDDYSALGWHKWLQFAELRGSLHRLPSSQSPQSMLRCGRKRS